MDFKDYDELVRAVDSNDGVLTCEMSTLRDVHRAGKLGVHVVASISSELDSRGLGHHPAQLPVNQWEKAKLFRRNTPAGDLIRAALSLDPKSDDVVRAFARNSANDIIKKIRELVCD